MTRASNNGSPVLHQNSLEKQSNETKNKKSQFFTVKCPKRISLEITKVSCHEKEENSRSGFLLNPCHYIKCGANIMKRFCDFFFFTLLGPKI